MKPGTHQQFRVTPGRGGRRHDWTDGMFSRNGPKDIKATEADYTTRQAKLAYEVMREAEQLGECLTETWEE